MPKNEDGEFELILGNRQLLSVFFIVVVLLGVFFTMGYIVGRNSSPALLADAGRKTETRPIIVDRPAPSSGSPTASASGTPPTESPTPAASTTPAAPPPQETPAPVQPPKPAPERPAVKPEPASPTPDVPAAGSTYLQVAAVAKTEAELFVDVLAKKGFHALYTTAPIPNTYRVLVGPFQDSSAVAQARADLNKAGFKGFEAIVRKY
jgi:cell division septation protein DedD